MKLKSALFEATEITENTEKKRVSVPLISHPMGEHDHFCNRLLSSVFSVAN